MVRPHQLLTGEVVEVRGEPLRRPPRIAEHDRRAVRADQLEDARVHVRPDAARGLRVVEHGRMRVSGVAARLIHVVDRDDDLDVERLS